MVSVLPSSPIDRGLESLSQVKPKTIQSLVFAVSPPSL